MNDAAAPPVRIGATEAQHVYFLPGHRTNHLRAGHENTTLGPEDDHIGQRRSVGRTTCGRAQYDRNLCHFSGDARHRGEHASNPVEAGDTFAQAGTAGVPDSYHRAGIGECSVVRGDDGSATYLAHGPALHRRIGREGDHRGTRHVARGHEDAAVIFWSDRSEGSVVKKGAQTYAR